MEEKRKYFTEKGTVQSPIIQYVSEPSAEYDATSFVKMPTHPAWQYVSPEEALKLRGGETGVVFKEIFLSQIKKFNPSVTDDLAQEFLKKVNAIPANIEGNLLMLEYLRGIRTIFIPSEKREKNVKLIDFQNIDNNIFQVTEEFVFSTGTKTIRADIVFLINGIPVILVETKAPHVLDGINKAFEQIKRYHSDAPEFCAILQLYAITHIIQFYYAPTFNLSAKNLFNWKDEKSGNFEELVKSFFNKERILKIISDYILFVRQDDELKKLVMRPHQMRAIEKLKERAKDQTKKRALIWHTQGSGKTYTMIVAAQKLLTDPEFENPTVIMLVDRNELESQLYGNLQSVGVRAEIAKSKKHLKELLEEDRRGLIVSMIHKFEEMPENINTRKNIYVLIDEAHRTTSGKLGTYLMGALPNAKYIGFTGTPIAKTTKGQGTFKTFGKDDPPLGYLDKYSIAESIEDGTTVPLHYAHAPNELMIDKETLEKEFLYLKEAEGISDIEELNKILDKAVNLKNMLKAPDRVEKVAKYVAKHYEENIEPLGYKAFLVAVDREACALYKEALDKYLPPYYSQVVFSPFYNDSPELKKYHLSEDEEKIVRKKFKNPEEQPKILIVTEKLLTGFDAPVLYCLYLDKPMRDHVLLQTIARVNRPYEDENYKRKTCGLILDFVGIFSNLDKALAFDSADIKGIVEDIALLKDRFSHLIEEAKRLYLVLIENRSETEAIETIIEHFRDEEVRNKFYKFFKELSTIYDIISPDEFLRPYISDMETLVKIYNIVKEAYEPTTPIDRDFSKKVNHLVRSQTTTNFTKSELEVYEINEFTLRKIEESNTTDTERVFNLLKSILKHIDEHKDLSPYLISIGEKAMRIIELYKQKQKDAQNTLLELKRLVTEITETEKEQKEKGLSKEAFTAYKIMKDLGINEAQTIAEGFQGAIAQYPYWLQSEQQQREMKRKLYAVFMKNGIDEQLSSNIIEQILKTLKDD